MPEMKNGNLPDFTSSYTLFGTEGVDTVRGHRYVDSAEVTIGGINATLFAVTDEKVHAGTLVEQSEVGAADRALTFETERLLEVYNQEQWLTHSSERGQLPLPFIPLEQYLDNPDRMLGMTVSIDQRPFTLNPGLQPFKDKLVGEQLASGRNLSDGANTAVSSFDQATNTLRLRQVGYYDMFVTQNFGADIPLDTPITINGRTGSTIRELAGDGQLPEINEESLITNSLGLGGILRTSDNKILFCRRKGNLGVGSASGTFGFSAAGNLPWNDTLREAFDSQPAHEALADQGIGKEAHEELGLTSYFANPVSLLGNSIAQIAERSLNLNPGECAVTPIGIMRDALHMGHPQTAYYLETPLSSVEVIGRMLQSEDGKKEFDLVLAVDANLKNIDRVIRNEAAETGVNFNLEIRATLALLLSQENGRALLTQS